MSQLVSHLSASQIRMYIRCSQQYFYRYIQGLIIPPSGAMVLGSAYHEGLADRFRYVIEREEQPSPQLSLDTFDTAFERIKHEYQIKEEDDAFDFENIEWEEDPGVLKDTGASLIRTYEQHIAPSIQPVTVEQKEVLVIQPDEGETIPIHLVTDLTTPEDCVDHKVKGRRFSEDELSQDIQATVYQMATGLPLSFHVALKTKKPTIDIQRTQRYAADEVFFVRQAQKVWQAIQAGIFVPVDQGWHCNPRFCGYYSRCKGG